MLHFLAFFPWFRAFNDHLIMFSFALALKRFERLPFIEFIVLILSDFSNRIMIILQFDSTNFFHWFRKVLTIWLFLLENIATLLALPFLHCLYGVWLKQMIFLKKNKWSKQILFKWIQCDEIKILSEKFSLRELENYFLHGHF